MGLSNEAVLAGHIGLNLDWSGGSAPRKVVDPTKLSFLDNYFTRPATKMGATIDSDKIPNPKAPHLDQDLYMAERAMLKAGIPKRIFAYTLAQILHETNDFKSPLATRGWNWSGIKYSKWAHDNVDAFNDKGYAGYRTLDGWATDYYRILNLAPGHPFAATTAQEFLDGLYSNKYFTAPKDTYGAALNRKLKIANAFINRASEKTSDIAKDVANQNKRDDANANKGTGNMWDWMKAHPMLTGVGLTFIGIIGLKAITHR